MKTFKIIIFLLFFPLQVLADPKPFDFYHYNWYAHFNIHVGDQTISAYEYINSRHRDFYIKDIKTNQLVLIGALAHYETLANESTVMLKPSDKQDYLVQHGALKPNIDFYTIEVQPFQFNLNGKTASVDQFELFTL